MEIDKNKVYYSKEGFAFHVVKYNAKSNYCVCFAYEQGFMQSILITELDNFPSFKLYGKAYFDVNVIEEYDKKRKSLAFRTWSSILHRVGEFSYKNVDVCKEWLLFSRFEIFHNKWYKKGFVIDKDLLSGEDKIYSPNTCTYMPGYLNNSISSEFNNHLYSFSYSKGQYSFVIAEVKTRVLAKTLKDIIHKFAVYRCMRVRTYYNTCWKDLRPEAREKINKVYQVEYLERHIKEHLKED